jgi:hypothetical protein
MTEVSVVSEMRILYGQNDAHAHHDTFLWLTRQEVETNSPRNGRRPLGPVWARRGGGLGKWNQCLHL